MTIRIERTFEFDAPPERVWDFISDPGNRAEAISVVAEWETNGDETVWYIEIPIPLIKRTFTVRTREVERVENELVRFTGRSRVMDVEGEHTLTPVDSGTQLVNRFVVDGHLPGIEQFFERNLDQELDNLKNALDLELGLEV